MDRDCQAAYGMGSAKEPSDAVAAFLGWVKPLIDAHSPDAGRSMEELFQARFASRRV